MLSRFIFFMLIFFVPEIFSETNWNAEVYSSEKKVVIDQKSGANIIFCTTSTANDYNLYFHDRCWISDGTMMLFYSDRFGRNELLGYLQGSGEIVRLNLPTVVSATSAVASKKDNVVYVARNNQILKWKLALSLFDKSNIEITEDILQTLPAGANLIAGLNENCTGSLVSFGYKLEKQDTWKIGVVDVVTKKSDLVAELNFPIQHIQFSWSNPFQISFARSYGNDTAPLSLEEPPHARIWLVNTENKIPLPAFYQQPGELVTHECWWIDNLITFCGGFRPEESHVKIFNPISGNIRIAGAGAWWEQGTPPELSKVNWWHASGSPDGRWIAADNWHGDIVLFDAKTTQRKVLTEGHRTYGSGAHPHVGWDLNSKTVVFTSNKNGNPDVCIGEIPPTWFRD